MVLQVSCGIIFFVLYLVSKILGLVRTVLTINGLLYRPCRKKKEEPEKKDVEEAGGLTTA